MRIPKICKSGIIKSCEYAFVIKPIHIQCGFAHLAFEVDDVNETLNKLLAAGGSQYGELVTTEYEDGRKAVFVYTADIEGNIIEIQSWS